MNNITCHLLEIYTILSTILLEYKKFLISFTWNTKILLTIHFKYLSMILTILKTNSPEKYTIPHQFDLKMKNITWNVPEIVTISHIIRLEY